MERAADVEPPPELMTRLLFHVPGHAAAGAPRGGGRRRLAGLLQPVLQPRFVMGMALTILSFSMLGRYVMPRRQIQQADLDPVKIWMALDNRVHRLWDRTVKEYENIRFVYQIQSRLRDWQEERDAEAPAAAADDARRLPVTPPGAKEKNGNQ
jgi:hypothetical protein